ncbi:MAG: hypothetical protein KGV43_01725 [Arcobacter sp.]|nr:hypothetical protein [Arcobacter sp.]
MLVIHSLGIAINVNKNITIIPNEIPLYFCIIGISEKGDENKYEFLKKINGTKQQSISNIKKR